MNVMMMTIRPHLKGVAKTWLQSCAILQFCLIRRLEFAVSLVRYSAQAVPTPTGIKRDRIRYPLLLPFHSPLFPLLSPLRQTLLFCKQISRLNYTDILVLIPRSINLDCEILAWSNCRNPCYHLLLSLRWVDDVFVILSVGLRCSCWTLFFFGQGLSRERCGRSCFWSPSDGASRGGQVPPWSQDRERFLWRDLFRSVASFGFDLFSIRVLLRADFSFFLLQEW